MLRLRERFSKVMYIDIDLHHGMREHVRACAWHLGTGVSSWGMRGKKGGGERFSRVVQSHLWGRVIEQGVPGGGGGGEGRLRALLP